MDTQEIKKQLETKLKIYKFQLKENDSFYGSHEAAEIECEIDNLLNDLGYDFESEFENTRKMTIDEICDYNLQWIGVEVGGETEPVKKELNIPVIMIMVVIWFCVLWLGLVLIPNWLEHR